MSPPLQVVNKRSMLSPCWYWGVFSIIGFWVLFSGGCTAKQKKNAVDPETLTYEIKIDDILPHFLKNFQDVFRQYIEQSLVLSDLIEEVLSREELPFRKRNALKRAYKMRPELRFVDSRGLRSLGNAVLDVFKESAAHGLSTKRFFRPLLEDTFKKQRRRAFKYQKLSPPKPPDAHAIRRMKFKISVVGLHNKREKAEMALLEKLLSSNESFANLVRAFRQARRSRKKWALQTVYAELMVADSLMHYLYLFKQGAFTRAELQVKWHRTLEKRMKRAMKEKEAAREVNLERAKSDKDGTHLKGMQVPPLEEPLATLERESLPAYRDRILSDDVNTIHDKKSLLQLIGQVQPRHPQYRQLQALLSRLEVARSKENEVALPRKKPVVRLGQTRADIKYLKQVLSIYGYYKGLIDENADQDLMQALQVFQQAHGLEISSTLHPRAWKILSVPIEERIEQAKINLSRWRESAIDPQAFFVWVNIPQFILEVWHGPRRLAKMPVVVGKPEGKKCDEFTETMVLAFATPVVSGNIQKLIFNPFWNVTKTIKETELDPERAKDPLFYEKHGYEIIFPNTFREWVREMPGPANSLGFVKFIFPNPYEIYLHDTPHKYLFTRPRRAASHGCVRVGDPWELAKQVLIKDGQWDEARFKELFSNWQRMNFKPLVQEWNEKVYERLKEKAKDLETHIYLKKPVPIHIEYFTLWVDEGGHWTFFKDIYGYDRDRITNRKPLPCVPESKAARKGFDGFLERLESLRQKSLDLRAQIDDLLLLAQQTQIANLVKRRLMLKSVRQLENFREHYSKMEEYIQGQYEALKEKRDERQRAWQEREISRAVRLERLFKALVQLNLDTEKQMLVVEKILNQEKAISPASWDAVAPLDSGSPVGGGGESKRQGGGGRDSGSPVGGGGESKRQGGGGRDSGSPVGGGGESRITGGGGRDSDEGGRD